jgi:hypothetical protein
MPERARESPPPEAQPLQECRTHQSARQERHTDSADDLRAGDTPRHSRTSAMTHSTTPTDTPKDRSGLLMLFVAINGLK